MRKEEFKKAKEQIIARLDSEPDELIYLDRKREPKGIGTAQILAASPVGAARMIKQVLDNDDSIRNTLLMMMLTDDAENSITFDNYDFRKGGH